MYHIMCSPRSVGTEQTKDSLKRSENVILFLDFRIMYLILLERSSEEIAPAELEMLARRRG